MFSEVPGGLLDNMAKVDKLVKVEMEVPDIHSKTSFSPVLDN
jgi:hypothetical protein